MSIYSPDSSDDAHGQSPPVVADDSVHADDAHVDEAEATEIAEHVAETAVRRRFRPLEVLMLTLLTVSLLIHALTIARLLSVRDTLRTEIELLANSVETAKRDQIHYTLPIDQQIPIDMNVPIKRSLVIPINTQVHIKQDIVLPVNTAFGNLNIPIPVDANVPISTTVPIDFDQTVNISTTVPLKLNVPIQINLGSSELSGYLDRLHQALLDLRDKF